MRNIYLTLERRQLWIYNISNDQSRIIDARPSTDNPEYRYNYIGSSQNKVLIKYKDVALEQHIFGWMARIFL